MATFTNYLRANKYMVITVLCALCIGGMVLQDQLGGDRLLTWPDRLYVYFGLAFVMMIFGALSWKLEHHVLVGRVTYGLGVVVALGALMALAAVLLVLFLAFSSI